jgi:hypothetical protein
MSSGDVLFLAAAALAVSSVLFLAFSRWRFARRAGQRAELATGAAIEASGDDPAFEPQRILAAVEAVFEPVVGTYRGDRLEGPGQLLGSGVATGLSIAHIGPSP